MSDGCLENDLLPVIVEMVKSSVVSGDTVEREVLAGVADRGPLAVVLFTD